MKTSSVMLSFILIILSQIWGGCETPQGHRGASANISESKKRGVFIKEYTTYPNPYKINDTLKLNVKEAWLEKKWASGRTYDKTKLYGIESYQLSINTTEEEIKGCAITWTIGIDFDKNLRPSSTNSLIGDFKTITPDTINFKVQKGDNLSDSEQKVILGDFVLIKRQ
jgi:hypothetical protein